LLGLVIDLLHILLLEAGHELYQLQWRRGGLILDALASGSSGLSSSPGQGLCLLISGKTLDPRSASLHPGVQMGTGKSNAVVNPVMDLGVDILF